MKKKLGDIRDFDWNWLKSKCKTCWKLNKDRKIQKQWRSFHIKTCKKHTKDLQELVNLTKKSFGETS